MQVKLDISDVLALEARAVQQLGSLGKRMLSVAKVGAEYEKGHKTYQDRTGNLKKSTKGVAKENRKDNVEVDLEMGMDYASFVKRRGYSEIDAAAKLTEGGIQDQIDAIAKAITG